MARRLNAVPRQIKPAIHHIGNHPCCHTRGIARHGPSQMLGNRQVQCGRSQDILGQPAPSLARKSRPCSAWYAVQFSDTTNGAFHSCAAFNAGRCSLSSNVQVNHPGHNPSSLLSCLMISPFCAPIASEAKS